MMDNMDSSESHFSHKRAQLYVLVIMLANFIRNLGVSIVDIGLPHFIIELSGTLAAYGLVIGIFSLFQAIFQFPMAIASDRYGRKFIVLVGMLIYILGTFLCFLAQNLLQLIIFRAIQGAGAYSSILQAVFGELYKKEKHGKGMALYSFSLALGYFGGIIFGGYIAYYLGFRMVFLISAILATISAVFILLFFKDHRQDNKDFSENGTRIKFSDVKILLNERQYLLAVILNSMRWFLFGGILVYLIWVMEIYWKISIIRTTYLLFFIVAIYIAFVLFSGSLVDRHNPKKILILGQLLILGFGLLFIVVNFTNNFILFYIASIATGIGFALVQTAGNSFLLKNVEKTYPELKGSGFGFNNAIGFLCGSMGPITLSYLGEIDIFLPYYFIATIVLLALLLTLKFAEN
ncbi:MAG: MFS transporter [Promethearchaeota archaeon]